ncbi:hypothetical protein I4U23_005254 [Adineta vaga]|nr:hypothetical protein I4U23_005254 [Adineta vaga]
MFASSGVKEGMGVCMLIVILAVSNVQSETTKLPSVSCSSSQLLCGGSICYDPTTQSCTALGTVIQCISVCGSQCYNPSTQKCFNGTVCSLSEQLCVIKYESSFGSVYNPPLYQCYNPTSQGCFNNTLCQHPYRSCNQRCLRYTEVCVNNVTACNVTNGYYYNYQENQMQLCNGVCYDSFTQRCLNGTIRCINNCSGSCYNSTSQQCFNGTVCSLSEQLCVVKYESNYGYAYNPPTYQCYNPTSQGCFNNTLCQHPYRSCNQRCLRYTEVCVNNVTACNVTNGYYYNYQENQMQLCNGVCYDSFTQRCLNGTIRCINNCSGSCYNSTSQQCFNGTVCRLSEQLCVVKYESNYGYAYNPPTYQCYNPTSQGCFNNTLCQHPYRSCNQRCLRYTEVCVNNVTACNVTNGYYYNYQENQMQLCNGVCYDSFIQRCVGDYLVHCIRDPSTQVCIDQPNTTSITTSTLSPSTTTTTPYASSSCCSAKQCTEDADCCVPDIECQCFRHNNQDYGSCLNPYIQPICAKGCPAQEQCRRDTDCCKCQCGQVTVSSTNGTTVTRKQCVPR